MDYMAHVTIGKWKGITNYECKLCPFATVESMTAILKHLRGKHFPLPAPSVILVADRSGKEVAPPEAPEAVAAQKRTRIIKPVEVTAQAADVDQSVNMGTARKE